MVFFSVEGSLGRFAAGNGKRITVGSHVSDSGEMQGSLCVDGAYVTALNKQGEETGLAAAVDTSAPGMAVSALRSPSGRALQGCESGC